MFIAMNAQAELVQLHSHEQAQRLYADKFFCPACRRPVRIKNGAVIPAHFAHIGPACAAASEPESADHLAGKLWLAALGERLGYTVALEVYYPLIKQRADVVWVRSETTIVIEFQCSPLNADRLKTRTDGYRRLGLRCVWVLGPRYQSRRPGKMQARFLQSQQAHDYYLWFSDGRRYLERWQWQPDEYRITRYTGGSVQLRSSQLQRSRYHAAQLISNQLRHRDRRVLGLQAQAYQHNRHLAGVPWLVHEALTELPGLALPEWQLRTRWLLKFEGADVDYRREDAFWQAQVVAGLTPLVDAEALMQVVADHWRRQLLATGHLAATPTGWRWLRPVVWYPDIEHKLAAIAGE